MRRMSYLAALLALLLLAACGAAEPVEEAPGEATPTTEAPALATVAAPTSDAGTSEAEAAYPPQAVMPDPPTPLPDDYPAPPTPPPTVDPYPGGVLPIIKPVGVQCEEGTEVGYGSPEEAAATLAESGVEVTDVQVIELMVTTVCGGPTSEHYRAEISPEDLDMALSLGWSRSDQ